jgi:hypothetical protein
MEELIQTFSETAVSEVARPSAEDRREIGCENLTDVRVACLRVAENQDWLDHTTNYQFIMAIRTEPGRLSYIQGDLICIFLFAE